MTKNSIPSRPNSRFTVLLLAFVLATVAAPTESGAQSSESRWAYFTELNAAYNTNPVGILGAQASSLVSFEGGLNYGGEFYRVGYGGRYATYREFGELDAYTHHGSVSLGTRAVFLDANVEQRLSGGAGVYDYLAANASLTTQFRVAGVTASLIAGGRLYDFVDLTNRNQRALLGAVRVMRSFSSGTTFILTGGAGVTEYTAEPELDAEIPETPVSAADSERPMVRQVNGTFRAAQSITSTTGLAAQYQFRRLNGETPERYIVEVEGVSYALLDDPSLYSLESLGAELTQMLFGYSVSLKVGAYVGRRKYLTQGDYLDEFSYDSSSLRQDDYTALWLRASWDPRFTRQDISFEFGAQWVDNRSSSYWYAYGDSYLSLGIGYNF